MSCHSEKQNLEQKIEGGEPEYVHPFNEGLLFAIIYKIYKKNPGIINTLLEYNKKIFIKFGSFFYRFNKDNYDSHIYLFFPWNIIGGADKVNLEIANSILDYKPIIFFTDRIDRKLLKNNYPRGLTIINLTNYYIKYLHWFQQYFYAGIISAKINETIFKENEKNAQLILLGSNSCLFYEILKNIRVKCFCIDVVHAFIGIEKISIPVVPKIDKRILITPTLYPKIVEQYNNHDYSQYLNRTDIIYNGVEIPNNISNKPDNDSLKIIFVGRECPEKRIHLIGKIAKECKHQEIPASFTVIGASKNVMDSEDCKYCSFSGEITDKEDLNFIYQNSDIILIVSSFEGFPMAIMEGMAYGVVPITTDVGGIKDHVINNETGFCVPNLSEKQIIDDIVEHIRELSNNRDNLHEIQLNVHNYAKKHFSIELFRKKYRDMILSAIQN
jgi:glycosyltransferase involved in cell wall biosynthesis